MKRACKRLSISCNDFPGEACCSIGASSLGAGVRPRCFYTEPSLGGGNMDSLFNVGIDVGSTTIKLVVLDKAKQIVYKNYERHFS